MTGFRPASPRPGPEVLELGLDAKFLELLHVLRVLLVQLPVERPVLLQVFVELPGQLRVYVLPTSLNSINTLGDESRWPACTRRGEAGTT